MGLGIWVLADGAQLESGSSPGRGFHPKLDNHVDKTKPLYEGSGVISGK